MYSKQTPSVGGQMALKSSKDPTKSSGQPTRSYAAWSSSDSAPAPPPSMLRSTGAGEPSTAPASRPTGPNANESPAGRATHGPATGLSGGQPSLGRPTAPAANGNPSGRGTQGQRPAQILSFAQPSTPQLPMQNFDFFLVINFQATCDVHHKPQPEPKEIIELTAAKINSHTFNVDAIFHQYVSPRINKKLTKFCTQLTGISQCMVDGQPGIEPCLKKLSIWLNEQGLFKPEVTFATVSHGDWYLQQLLPKSLGASSSSALPVYFQKWIDISKIFQLRTGFDPTDDIDPISGMLSWFNLHLEGPRHSGIYICHNVTRVMKALATEKHCVFNITSS